MIGMAKIKLTVTVLPELMKWVDEQVEKGRFADRSHAVQYSLIKVKGLSVEKRRPPLTTIFLWIVGVLTLVLTGYGIFTGVALALPFPYNILIVINSAMIGIVEIFVGALIDTYAK